MDILRWKSTRNLRGHAASVGSKAPTLRSVRSLRSGRSIRSVHSLRSSRSVRSVRLLRSVRSGRPIRSGRPVCSVHSARSVQLLKSMHAQGPFGVTSLSVLVLRLSVHFCNNSVSECAVFSSAAGRVNVDG